MIFLSHPRAELRFTIFLTQKGWVEFDYFSCPIQGLSVLVMPHAVILALLHCPRAWVVGMILTQRINNTTKTSSYVIILHQQHGDSWVGYHQIYTTVPLFVPIWLSDRPVDYKSLWQTSRLQVSLTDQSTTSLSDRPVDYKSVHYSEAPHCTFETSQNKVLSSQNSMDIMWTGSTTPASHSYLSRCIYL